MKTRHIWTSALVIVCHVLLAPWGCGGDPGTGVSFTGSGSIGGDTYSYATYVDAPPNRSVNCTSALETTTFTSVSLTSVVAEHDVGESFAVSLSFDAATLVVSMATLTAGNSGMTYEGTACTATVNGYKTNRAAVDFDVTCTASTPSGGPALSFSGAFTVCNPPPGK